MRPMGCAVWALCAVLPHAANSLPSAIPVQFLRATRCPVS